MWNFLWNILLRHFDETFWCDVLMSWGCFTNTFERRFTSPPPCVTCHMSCLMCHISYVTCQVSHVKCHMSFVTIKFFIHIYFLDTVMTLVGRWSVFNGSSLYLFIIMNVSDSMFTSPCLCSSFIPLLSAKAPGTVGLCPQLCNVKTKHSFFY